MSYGQKINSYDQIASFYNPLSLFLGRSYRNSKFCFLDEIKEGDQVLYLGGGTGENLLEILDNIGETGKIFYIEASSQMLKKAKRRISPDLQSRICFLHQCDFSEIPYKNFDVLITQYFFDILPDDDIESLFSEINKRTDGNSCWIFLDFFEVKGRGWLIELMVQFFKFFTDNPRNDLPDYGHYFAHHGWKIHERKSIKKGFIQGWLLKQHKVIGQAL